MTSLSTQNRSRILDSLLIMKQGLGDKDGSTEDRLCNRATELYECVQNLEETLSHKPRPEPTSDETFVEEFLSSGAFSSELSALKEAEGSNWGSVEIACLSECMRDIGRSLSAEETRALRSLASHY